MKWWKDKILPAIVIAILLGCFGFFMDFQGLKAEVSNIKLEFKYLRGSLEEIKTDVKDIKRSLK